MYKTLIINKFNFYKNDLEIEAKLKVEQNGLEKMRTNEIRAKLKKIETENAELKKQLIALNVEVKSKEKDLEIYNRHEFQIINDNRFKIC